MQKELLELIQDWRDRKKLKAMSDHPAMVKGRAEVKELHDRATEKARTAYYYRTIECNTAAVGLMREAYELETKAAILAREFPTGELTYGLLALSAGYYALNEMTFWDKAKND